MIIDGLEIDIPVYNPNNDRQLINEAYHNGVIKGFTKYFGKSYTTNADSIMDAYTNGVMTGIGMSLWEFIKYIFSYKSI